MKKKIEFNLKHLIIVTFIILLLTILIAILYSKMVDNIKINNLKLENFAKENEKHVFKINKIVLYSNVDVIDESEKKSLQNISLSQYTDIAIYIDNTIFYNDLSAKNTIKEMYIENVKIDTLSSNGEKILNYKNSYAFGKYRNLEMAGPKIRFNILSDNINNLEEEYNNPTFYTDCSNPITLGYVNKNVVTNYRIRANDKKVSFDGAILDKANIALDVLNNKISFSITIINNLDEKFVCNVCIDNNLENEDGGLYTGYIMKIFDISEDEYNFIKLTY